MTGRGPRGSRRWTILLALLALVVVGGALLRATAVELGREEPAQRTAGSADDRPARDGGPVPPSRADDPVEGGEIGAPLEGDLVIEVREVVAADGGSSDVVRTLGPVLLDSQATLPYAVSRLGEPDSSGPSEVEPDVCTARWTAYELRASFRFGHPPSPEASCSRGPLVFAIARGAQWRVEPLGLAIGDAAATLEQSLAGATPAELPPALAQLLEAPEAYVLATGAYGDHRSPILYATAVDGRIESFAFVSNAD